MLRTSDPTSRNRGQGPPSRTARMVRQSLSGSPVKTAARAASYTVDTALITLLAFGALPDASAAFHFTWALARSSDCFNAPLVGFSPPFPR